MTWRWVRGMSLVLTSACMWQSYTTQVWFFFQPRQRRQKGRFVRFCLFSRKTCPKVSTAAAAAKSRRWLPAGTQMQLWHQEGVNTEQSRPIPSSDTEGMFQETFGHVLHIRWNLNVLLALVSVIRIKLIKSIKKPIIFSIKALNSHTRWNLSHLKNQDLFFNVHLEMSPLKNN